MAMNEKERQNVILVLLDCLEVSMDEKRISALRSLAYLCQGEPSLLTMYFFSGSNLRREICVSGVFAEIETEGELVQWCRKNCFLLYKMGVFTALFDTLKLKVDFLPRTQAGEKTVAAANHSYASGGYAASTVAASGAPGSAATSRKPNSQAATLGDCVELRYVMSVVACC